MEPFEHPDPYELLGISPNADAATIKEAYSRQIALYDPKRFAKGTATQQQYVAQRAERITAAYHQITDSPRSPSGRALTHLNDPLTKKRLYGVAKNAESFEEARPWLELIYKTDPKYRDVAALLANAQTASPIPATNRRRKARVWLGGSLLVAGVLAILGWQLRSKAPSTIVSGDFRPIAPSASIGPSPEIVVEIEPSSSPMSQADPATPIVLPSATIPNETRLPSATVAPTEVPPPPPVAINPGSIESGPVIISTNFGGPVVWLSLSTATYSLGQQGGGYVITAAPNIGAIYGHGGPLPQGNVVVAADVTVQSGLGGLWFGPGKGYRFVIEPGGTYRIEVGTANGPVILAGPTPSRAIQAGTNRLQVAVQGRAASFYANGVLLRQITLGTGMAGIPAGLAVIPTNVAARSRFDNFVVRGLPSR